MVCIVTEFDLTVYNWMQFQITWIVKPDEIKNINLKLNFIISKVVQSLCVRLKQRILNKCFLLFRKFPFSHLIDKNYFSERYEKFNEKFILIACYFK